MILNDDKNNSFEELEEIVENTSNLEYVVVNFDFIQNGNDIVFDKQFIALDKGNMEFYAKGSHHSSFLSDILKMSLSIVVYSATSFEKNKKSIIDIVFKVIKRRLSEDTFLKIDNNIVDDDIVLSYNNLFQKDSKLLRVISDTLLALKYTKDLIKKLSILDKNFLDESQIIEIVMGYDKDIYTKLEHINDDEKFAYIKDIYDGIEEEYLPILKQSSNNLKHILKTLKLEQELSSILLGEFQNSLIEFDMLQTDELYQFIYDGLKNKKIENYYQSAENYFLEIKREVKYLNLYQLDTAFAEVEKTKILKKLYEDMENNVLRNVAQGHTKEFLYGISEKYLLIDNDIEVIKQKHRDMMEEELNNYYKGDLEAYEDDLSSEYIGYFYGADKYGVSMEQVLATKVYDDEKRYMESYIYENHHTEMMLIDKYMQSKQIISKEIEVKLINEIPTTKIVRGKRSKLKKADIKKLLKHKKKHYTIKVKQEREDNRLKKHQEIKKVLKTYSQSLETDLDLQMEISRETTSLRIKAKAEGVNEWDAVMETEVNPNIIKTSRIISEVRESFKSTTDEIKKEKKEHNDSDIIAIRKKGQLPLLSL